MRTLATIILVWTLSSPTLASPQQHTISKTEVRANSPQITHRQLRDVVWDMFEVQDYRTKKTPTRPLSDLGLRTKSVATHTPDLCRYDEVEVKFERVDPDDATADAQTKAVAIEASSHFHFLSVPPSDVSYIRTISPLSQRHCEKLGPDTPFFTAADERTATDGFRGWSNLLADLRAGKNVPLKCDPRPFDKESCADAIRAIKPEDLNEVRTCESQQSDHDCYEIFATDRLLRILITGHVYPGPPAGQIIDVDVKNLIITGDYRAD